MERLVDLRYSRYAYLIKNSDWRLIRNVEAHRTKLYAEIINYVNDILTRQYHYVRYDVVFVPVVSLDGKFGSKL